MRLSALFFLLGFSLALVAGQNGTNSNSSTTSRPEPARFVAQMQGGEAPENSSANQPEQMVQFQQSSNRCPPLFGQNFPSGQRLQANSVNQQSCQWVIITDRKGCPMFFQNCGSNPPMCQNQNEIWWQCTSNCEPSCGNPTPNCRQSCGSSGCQCFPGFLRNQNGFCVPSDQCPNDSSCSSDDDCPGTQICESRQCTDSCSSDDDCNDDEQCFSNGRCMERRDCTSSDQCRGAKICFSRQCRFVNSIFCRGNFDCPRSAFCGRNGRCAFRNFFNF